MKLFWSRVLNMAFVLALVLSIFLGRFTVQGCVMSTQGARMAETLFGLQSEGPPSANASERTPLSHWLWLWIPVFFVATYIAACGILFGIVVPLCYLTGVPCTGFRPVYPDRQVNFLQRYAHWIAAVARRARARDRLDQREARRVGLGSLPWCSFAIILAGFIALFVLRHRLGAISPRTVWIFVVFFPYAALAMQQAAMLHVDALGGALLVCLIALAIGPYALYGCALDTARGRPRVWIAVLCLGLLHVAALVMFYVRWSLHW